MVGWEGKGKKTGDEKMALPKVQKATQALTLNTAVDPQVPPCGWCNATGASPLGRCGRGGTCFKFNPDYLPVSFLFFLFSCCFSVVFIIKQTTWEDFPSVWIA